jgi:hypothetical protein
LQRLSFNSAEQFGQYRSGCRAISRGPSTTSLSLCPCPSMLIRAPYREPLPRASQNSIFLALNFHILVSALLNFSIHKLSFLHSLLLR